MILYDQVVMRKCSLLQRISHQTTTFIDITCLNTDASGQRLKGFILQQKTSDEWSLINSGWIPILV